MSNETKYTDMPEELVDSFNRSVRVPNFELTPEGVKQFVEQRKKKPVNIYLSVGTIEKFKAAAKKNGGRYQTMISDVLDTYTEQYL